MPGTIQGLPPDQAFLYVGAAYIGIWLVVVIYVAMMANQVSKVRREIKLLVEQVAKRTGGTA